MHTALRFGLLGLLALAPIGVARAETGKNLKVLPGNTDVKDIKKLMKAQAKALGVQCDFCHDTDDFAKDAKKEKEIGRAMMRMVGEINGKYFKGKPQVGCVTCHNGKAEPPKPS